LSTPILVFGWGNPSRGDDALGPLFVDAIESLALPHVECLTDFQLQVEHALDLQGRSRVLFIDASLDAEAPFSITPIAPAKDTSFTTHAMSPQSVLHVYTELNDDDPPPTWLLAIRGERFELGEELTPAAREHLAQALAWATPWLASS
jgi:hydrogenase maturation protease